MQSGGAEGGQTWPALQWQSMLRDTPQREIGRRKRSESLFHDFNGVRQQDALLTMRGPYEAKKIPANELDQQDASASLLLEKSLHVAGVAIIGWLSIARQRAVDRLTHLEIH